MAKQDSKMASPKFIDAQREAIGIVMLSISTFYIGINLLLFHGWVWVDPHYSWVRNLNLGPGDVQSLYWLNSVSFVLFILSIITFIVGFTIFKPGEGPVKDS
jgi:hypothetical protein